MTAIQMIKRICRSSKFEQLARKLGRWTSISHSNLWTRPFECPRVGRIKGESKDRVQIWNYNAWKKCAWTKSFTKVQKSLIRDKYVSDFNKPNGFRFPKKCWNKVWATFAKIEMGTKKGVAGFKKNHKFSFFERWHTLTIFPYPDNIKEWPNWTWPKKNCFASRTSASEIKLRNA